MTRTQMTPVIQFDPTHFEPKKTLCLLEITSVTMQSRSLKQFTAPSLHCILIRTSAFVQAYTERHGKKTDFKNFPLEQSTLQCYRLYE